MYMYIQLSIVVGLKYWWGFYLLKWHAPKLFGGLNIMC